MYRPSYLEVNGDTIYSNVKNIIKNYNSYKYYFGVVKNNAYHHGIYSVKFMIDAGINYLAVSSLEETIEIRKYVTDIPILCLEPINFEYVHDAINNNVTLTISSLDDVNFLLSQNFKDEIKVHLKINTGMNRLGFNNSLEFEKAIELLRRNKYVYIEGLYSHLATSGIQDPHYNGQIESFKDITKNVDYNDFDIIHLDRSLTLVLHDKIKFVNGVRLGISMYGFEQNIPEGNFLAKFRRKLKQNKYDIDENTIHLKNKLTLKYPLSLYSKIIQIREVKKGEFIGYGASCVADHDMFVATIPVGYADGVSASFRYVYVNNTKCNILAECMDMIMIEITSKIKLGAVVEIIGKNQTVKNVADRVGQNGHKFLNNFSNRLPVVYKYKNEIIEIKY